MIGRLNDRPTPWLGLMGLAGIGTLPEQADALLAALGEP
jgi:hypothetical protein